MATDSNVAPVIIRKKRRQKDAHAHHGGAWKVAYADFVTAMMAFFMLMWLLNATTEQQRKGIADYFSPSIPIARDSGGGDGPLSGHSAFAESLRSRSAGGGVLSENADRRASDGLPDPVMSDHARPRDDAGLDALEEALRGRTGESLADDDQMRHIVTRVTDQGLIVELFSLPGAPLWDAAGPTELLRGLAGVVARASGIVENSVSVEAHVRARPVVLAANTSWEDSAARAQGLRRLLEATGLPARRVHRVTGHADRRPATADPMAERNDRFEIVFLRQKGG
ncbi:flagellar motor protein MotB [Rhodosalinus sp.]|uniref:flagellar motor protein MotB n=1 Tax=Rhodosalinus sp. TaxID=2047741 RepID=UPI00397A85A3